ncbi:hypothetical protein PI86_06245 [Burkholderia sp. A9]|uniref:GAF domain-containing sensor histidine kinase n=1 Tax=Burkholderia sp. A9 TaxID=1365108 RepID=UPI0005758430|nr:ATP-binding protein [Burkholderia sp. A9]KHK60010.1 hypothetical protein PI86_06245 [Burkholderia sp. A9]
MYLRAARRAYLRWGSTGKVLQLDNRYPQFVRDVHGNAVARCSEAPVEHLDLATVLKVSQAVSGEIDSNNLIQAVIRTAVEHAGADRGALVVANGPVLRVEAEAISTSDSTQVSLDIRALDAVPLPKSAIHYAIRSRESVIVNDTAELHDFSGDPYFGRSHYHHSVACMPLVRQGRPIALLYLENSLASNVFTAHRIAVLKLLASQAAISLENARLYLDEVRAALERVVNNGTRANDVVTRLRELVKRAPPRCEYAAVNDAIREVITLAHGESSKHGVTVLMDLEEGLPDIYGDRMQLQLVVMNLVVNAIEAMAGGGEWGRELAIATYLGTARNLCISIGDTGPGLDAARSERLFEPFYTTDATGMGMGLSICRSIVEAHCGPLHVRVNEPRGAVLRVELHWRKQAEPSIGNACARRGSPKSGWRDTVHVKTVRDATQIN